MEKVLLGADEEDVRGKINSTGSHDRVLGLSWAIALLHEYHKRIKELICGSGLDSEKRIN